MKSMYKKSMWLFLSRICHYLSYDLKTLAYKLLDKAPVNTKY
jgi:hypothetical protein